MYANLNSLLKQELVILQTSCYIYKQRGLHIIWEEIIHAGKIPRIEMSAVSFDRGAGCPAFLWTQIL